MRRNFVLIGSAFLSAPALADHVGPSGVGGGGVNVVSADTLDEGAVALGLRVSYTRPEQRSDATLSALAGQHVHAHNTDYNLNGSLGLAYGITHALTLSVELPYVRRDHLREGVHSHAGGVATNGVEALGSVSGIGDANVLARYRLVDSAAGKFALIAGLKLPTGSTHEHSLGGERLETEHQPGTESWDPIIGAAFGGKAGPVVLAASGLYQFSGRGAQQTRLGDRAQIGLAISHRFGPPEHHHAESAEQDDAGSHHHVTSHGHQSWDAFVELTGEWEGRQKIGGEIEQESGGKTLWLTPGARFNAASGFAAGLGLGVPLWQHIRASHPDNDYRLTLSVGQSF